MEIIERDFEQASCEKTREEKGISPKELQMLRYALKLTERPQDMKQSDVGALRERGWSDRDILEIVEVTAYYAYVNRIADGLGVQLEELPGPED